MDQWLTGIITALPEGGTYLFIIFLIAFFESLPAVGLLVPGSTLIVASGFLASHNHGSILSLAFYSMVGAYLGDLISFELGRKYGSTLLKIQPLQRKRHLIKQSQIFFTDHGGKSLFFARFLGPIRGITPFIAGVSEMPRNLFNIYTPISAILWGVCYPGIGYLGGNSWQRAQSLSSRFGMIVVLALAVTAIHYVVKHQLSSNKNKHN